MKYRNDVDTEMNHIKRDKEMQRILLSQRVYLEGYMIQTYRSKDSMIIVRRLVVADTKYDKCKALNYSNRTIPLTSLNIT